MSEWSNKFPFAVVLILLILLILFLIYWRFFFFLSRLISFQLYSRWLRLQPLRAGSMLQCRNEEEEKWKKCRRDTVHALVVLVGSEVKVVLASLAVRAVRAAQEVRDV